LHDFGPDEDFEVGFIGPSVPVVGDMTSVHDFSKEVAQIIIRDHLSNGEVVVQDISADLEVSIIEVVVPGPALASELLPPEDQGVEEAESEEDGLELVGLGTLVDLRLVELAVGPADVGLEGLRRLVRHLQRSLQDRLGNDVHVRKPGRLRGNQAPELGVGGVLDLL